MARPVVHWFGDRRGALGLFFPHRVAGQLHTLVPPASTGRLIDLELREQPFCGVAAWQPLVIFFIALNVDTNLSELKIRALAAFDMPLFAGRVAKISSLAPVAIALYHFQLVIGISKTTGVNWTAKERVEPVNDFLALLETLD